MTEFGAAPTPVAHHKHCFVVDVICVNTSIVTANIFSVGMRVAHSLSKVDSPAKKTVLVMKQSITLALYVNGMDVGEYLVGWTI